MKHWFCMLLLAFSVTWPVCAQVTSYTDQVAREIDRRGLDREQLRALLFEKGIDLDNLENLTAQQILELQRALQELNLLQQASVVSLDTLPALLFPLEQAEPDSLEEDISDTGGEDSIVVAIYGHHLFKNGQIGVIPPNPNFNPPASYRIGAGDVLSVSIYARTNQFENTFTVRPDGAIAIRDGRVRVFVRGLTLAEARERLSERFRQFYVFTPADFTVNVSSVRTINVRVFGEVNVQGNYTVSALNSVLNLIAAAGGPTDNASVRNIQLNKRDGRTEKLDLYDLINRGRESSLFLEDGDLVFIPVAGKVVTIVGAVRRSHTYELTEEEGLFDLIRYAGGLQKDAYINAIKVVRYLGDRKVLKDIPYAQSLSTRQNPEILDGDEVTVEFIRDQLENYVTVSGAVRKDGDYERLEGMRISDLIRQAGLLPGSKTDLAFVVRTNEDESVNILSFSIDEVLSGTNPVSDILLKDRDQLIVHARERFVDNKTIKVAGAVRYPDEFPFDESGNLRAFDIITMAGGLSRDAASFAHIHRVDPLNPDDLEYVRLDLLRVMSEPNAADNVLLQPFDSIHVYSRNEFYDDLTVEVRGAVNNPGVFAFGSGMSLEDAIVLAGGLRRSAATNNIEISRVIIRDNQPTKTTVERIAVDRGQLTEFGGKGSYELEPFDNVFVRYVPEFELQQNVTILGEVILPGDYSLIRDNETVFDLITRAEGLTQEAFPPAATLYRAEDSLGFIVMRLEEVLANPSSRYNYTLKNGDVVTIPKKKDFVTIVGSTNAYRTLDTELLGADNAITVAFHQGKDALFYINTYAGGFADDARKDKIFVKYPNGEVKTTERRFPFGKKHPRVLPGSIISVGRKKPELNTGTGDQDVNWTRVLGDSVAQAMSILTLILLVQRLD